MAAAVARRTMSDRRLPPPENRSPPTSLSESGQIGHLIPIHTAAWISARCRQRARSTSMVTRVTTSAACRRATIDGCAKPTRATLNHATAPRASPKMFLDAEQVINYSPQLPLRATDKRLPPVISVLAEARRSFRRGFTGAPRMANDRHSTAKSLILLRTRVSPDAVAICPRGSQRQNASSKPT